MVLDAALTLVAPALETPHRAYGRGAELPAETGRVPNTCRTLKLVGVWPVLTSTTTAVHGHEAAQGSSSRKDGRRLDGIGFGFRKSFKVMPGVRVNLSRRSAGVSAGPRGAKVSGNTRGEGRTSLGWRGLFWRKRIR
jgi:hypothetical protein